MQSDAAKEAVSEKCIHIKSEKWNWMWGERRREDLFSAETGEIGRAREEERNRELRSGMQTERERGRGEWREREKI